MIKKLLALFLIFQLLILCASFSTASAENGDERYDKACEFFDLLTEVNFGSSPDAFISRDAFVAELVKLTKKDVVSDAPQIYSDVKPGSRYYDYISTAYKCGWIADAEKFNPLKPIVMREALKILLCVFEYSEFAERSGGYPDGYVKFAVKNDFTDGIAVNEKTTLTCRDATVLLYNILLSDAIEMYSLRPEQGNEVKTNYIKTGKLNLEKLLDIAPVKGIVTETQYSSLLLDADINYGKAVCIDGVRYNSLCFGEKYLGMKVTAYYCMDQNNEKKVIALIPEANAELTINMKDFDELTASTLRYTRENKNKKAQLDELCCFIYNGRRVDIATPDCFDSKVGDVRLLDNNNDGHYDVVFINEYEYYSAENVDYSDNKIGLRGFGMVAISDDDIVSCFSSDGEEIGLYEISRGDAVALKMSQDGLIKSFVRCNEIVNGKITSLDTENELIGIDNEEYTISSSFAQHSLDGLKLNNRIAVIIGLNNDVAVKKDFADEFKYGYMIKIASDGAFEQKVEVKIFNSLGETEIFDLADKITLDGEKSVREQDVIERLSAKSRTYGLIRYLINNAGEVASIDTSENVVDAQNVTDDNSLVKYADKSEFYYRSSPKAFIQIACIASAVLFAVPETYSEDEDDYDIVRINEMTGNTTYTADVYDVDKYGYAGAVVFYDASPKEITSIYSSGMVEKLNSAKDKNGEWKRQLLVWIAGKRYSYAVNDDVNLHKSSGEELSKGDIIRIRVRNGEIKSIAVDIDASQDTPVLEASSSAGVNAAPATLYYAIGYVYSANGNMITITDQPTDYTKLYPYSASTHLVPVNVKTVYTRYNKSKDTIETITMEELHTGIGFSNAASKIVARMTSDLSSVVYIYE